MEKFSVIVVGAGAAGMLAAGRAAEKGAKVLLLEKMRHEGRKILITGKGRCNITNDLPADEFIKQVYPNGRFLRNAFSHFYHEDILKLLKDNGVETVLERGGRYYPESQLAADVKEALVKWLKSLKVDIRTDHKADQLIIEEGKIKGLQCQQKQFKTRSVIIATGGKSYPVTGSTGDGYLLAEQAGHTIEPTRPALVPLETDSPLPAKLKNFSMKNINAVVWSNGKKVAEEFGEMGFAKNTLTGPVIVALSRTVVDEMDKGNEVKITVDLKPALDDKKLDNRLLRDLQASNKKQFKNIFSSWLPSALVKPLQNMLDIDFEKECNSVTANERKEIRKLFKSLTFKITGHKSWDEAIVTAGGVKISEVTPKTLESKKVSGLFFAGEVLDVDGATGGFNLQIAWSTGWLAGNSAAKDNPQTPVHKKRR